MFYIQIKKGRMQQVYVLKPWLCHMDDSAIHLPD